MSAGYRLQKGGLIDRKTRLNFTFNGQAMSGYEGDTLASALLASGTRIIGRSFKYHRPRGIFATGVEEPNALVQLERGPRTLPNQQATRISLYDGLIADSINCWPSPDYDAMSILGLFYRLIPAGFYYKTFMRPATAWRFYEYFIRHAAGLGCAPTEPDPDHYDKMNAHCDVLIVGAGPAGLTAALGATRSGARVILVDEQDQIGGWLLNENRIINGQPSKEWLNAAFLELNDTADAQILTKTTAFGYFDHNFIALCEHRGPTQVNGNGLSRQRIWRVRAKQVVLATGAIERPLVFADNDRPGVMLSGAVRAYAHRYGVAAGRRVLIFTNNDDAYRTGLALKEAGVAVPAIVDLRHDPSGELAVAAVRAGIEILDGSAVTRVLGSRGVTGVDIMNLNNTGDGVIGAPRRISCDVIATSGGWNPTIHLHSHSGGKTIFDKRRGIFLPSKTTEANFSVGAANGTFSLSDCLKAGMKIGKQAARNAGISSHNRRKAPVSIKEEEADSRLLWIVPTACPTSHKSRHFLDQANDVTVSDIQLAAREGYASIEHAKRYTTLGMAPDQGKTGNTHGLAVLSQVLGTEDPGETGTTTFRPPYTPVTIGALAGRDVGPLMDPIRMTPMHHWHELAGCAWEDVGQWKRPWYYPQNSEDGLKAVHRECLAVRNAVGILDASTLGKIDIRGPDAVILLNKVYTNSWESLKINRCRYGLMLSEDGMIFDDGVTTRLAKDHFLMTTTSGNAAQVLEWLEEWLQTEWPDLRVYCTSVTEQWANITICGPSARALLLEFTDDIDLTNESFPSMSMREGTIAGVNARVFRISYTGEISYEINVPASYGMHVWTALINAGKKYGITPFGTETMHVLRAEKGYIVVGQETDGTVIPSDLGMNWAVSEKKDFIGKRSLSRTNSMRTDRKQLVGLLTENPTTILPEGGQITAKQTLSTPTPMIGYITSSYYSAVLGHSIALALIKGGRELHGDCVFVPLEDKSIVATVINPIFYDIKGERLNG
ncbi:MAG: sarcosine oxidase subunit alpha [Rhodospirillaceae bacterium TMED8]|nr:sarcosine oxidase subunit alpha [Magnetovibrio sp.]OUT50762.1 MAG: sarcosine oxidase subunit alpha [Rhodospirillaceae bacterium TMED8]